jgi:hypothetical protein
MTYINQSSDYEIAGTWNQQAKLLASDGVAGDYFGMRIGISYNGNTVLVGAPQQAAGLGAAYVFTRAGSVWTQQQKLTASDAAVGDVFGGYCALSDDGNTAIIGAQGKNSITGAAYVFT